MYISNNASVHFTYIVFIFIIHIIGSALCWNLCEHWAQFASCSLLYWMKSWFWLQMNPKDSSCMTATAWIQKRKFQYVKPHYFKLHFNSDFRYIKKKYKRSKFQGTSVNRHWLTFGQIRSNVLNKTQILTLRMPVSKWHRCTLMYLCFTESKFAVEHMIFIRTVCWN